MPLIDRLKKETNHSNSVVLLVCYYKTTVIKVALTFQKIVLFASVKAL